MLEFYGCWLLLVLEVWCFCFQQCFGYSAFGFSFILASSLCGFFAMVLSVVVLLSVLLR